MPRIEKKETARKNSKEHAGELSNALAYLKLTIEDVVDAHRRKQRARITELKDHIASAIKSGKTKESKKAAILEKKIAEELASWKLHPDMGRAKDLLRMEKLLDKLLEHYPEEC